MQCRAQAPVLQFRTGIFLAQWMHAYTQLKDRLPYRHQHAVPGHTLELGTVERWTARTHETGPAFNRRFHLHSNHVLVTHRKGDRLDPPFWHDTIGLEGGGPADFVTFLAKYKDFTGRIFAHGPSSTTRNSA
ncbi:hypothetical protein AB0D38_11900 [Streptomyces sp. NPDC048279]|uniref:hypothetical protein n=1 Tax=Streptomyces sp. NPDC048279 TaxID=3154714 RepID=UPI00343EDAEB